MEYLPELFLGSLYGTLEENSENYDKDSNPIQISLNNESFDKKVNELWQNVDCIRTCIIHSKDHYDNYSKI